MGLDTKIDWQSASCEVTLTLTVSVKIIVTIQPVYIASIISVRVHLDAVTGGQSWNCLIHKPFAYQYQNLIVNYQMFAPFDKKQLS